ncbi:hypothetical protein IT087_00185 [Candidatus Uhrbacteria bacterium]|nr:hypothetical protein [Candidatus Uhrbacteria bacterium]
MDWRNNSSITPLRPEPEVVHICIIDADAIFSHQLGILLANELPKMVNVVGTYDGIPEPIQVPYNVSLVIFDPDLDDFRSLPAAVKKMRHVFGESAVLAVHADTWAKDGSVLRSELQDNGVHLGFKRFDLRKCIKLVTKIAMHEPIDLWQSEFAT